MSLPSELKTWVEGQGLTVQGMSTLEEMCYSEKGKGALQQYSESKDPNARTLYINCVPTHFISLSVSEDKLTASLTLIGFMARPNLIDQTLVGCLASVGIPQSERFEDFIVEAQQRDLVQDPYIEEPIITGKPAVPSEPPNIKLLVDAYSKKPRYNEDEEGNINYHDLNLFQNVIQDQHIADYIPAVEGENGRDVFGNLIPCEVVKASPISCGQGVVLDDTQGKYYASTPGYVVYEDRKIRVEKTYQILGNVDFTVGHINFISDVDIRGDVLTDFSVRSGGNMEIGGTVTGAQISCEGDLVMHKGSLGQGKGNIVTNGSAKIKFINETRIEVSGDLNIVSEALNSHLHCLSQIKAERAVVIGGEVVSLGGIEIGTIGSELGLRTKIFLGEDYRTLSRTQSLRDTILELREKCETKLMRYRQEIDEWQKVQENADLKEISKLRERLEEFLHMLSELKVLKQEYELLSSKRPEGRKASCRITRILYPGAVFFSGGALLEVKERVDGPVDIVEKKDRNGKNFIAVETVRD